MVKTVTTDAGAFAVYEANLRAAEGGSAPLLDLSDTGFYGSSGQGMTAAELQRENIQLSAVLLAGDRGYSTANPMSVEAVSQIAETLMSQVNQVSGLTSEPNANFTDAELQARASQLSADMLAQFQAQISANPAVASFLPSTPEEEAQFNSGVQTAIRNMANARDYTQRILNGDSSPETVGLAVNGAISVAVSVLSVLPLPPAAKAAVNVVSFATALVPGIVAASKGEGDPAELLTIGIQLAASVLTWGASDYFFDYIAPVIVSAAVNAELGADGLIDLSPTAITQGLVEAAVHDNGGTLPDWWYSGTGGSGNGDNTTDRAIAIADAYGGLFNSESYMAKLSAQLTAQYSGYGNYYQELTLNLNADLGETRYYFSKNGVLTHRPYFSGSNIVFPGVDPNSTNPWDFIHVSNSPSGINGGLYVLEKDTVAFSTSNVADIVFAPAGRPVNLLGGKDSFNFSQDVDGGTGVSTYYQTVTAGLIDGGDGFDTMSLVGLTEGNAKGYTGDLVIDHNTVRYVTGPFYGLDASNFRTIAAHQNFEEFHTSNLRLFDMRQAAYAVKLVTENAFDGVSLADVYGSAHGDTLIIDTSRSVTASVTLWQGQVTSVNYGDNSNQLVAVDAGAGHDYVAGELVNGATYQGGAGVDTFEILTPDVNRAAEPYVRASTYFVTSLDLESGATWMRTHAVAYSVHDWITEPHYDVLIHTDTTATVQGFEWAVGSQYHDAIYARIAGSRISGQAGNDTLTGRDGQDQLYGGDGHDSLLGGGGTDRLQGGTGNDTLDGGAGRDVIMGNSGNDVITDLQGANLISGGAGNDRITTGDAANEIFGGAGNDTITAGNGDNLISGGADNDSITTGSGNDTIDLGTGVDALSAEAGDDVVTDTWSAGGGTVIDGGAGYDVLTLYMTGHRGSFGDIASFQSDSFSYEFTIGVWEAAPPTGYVNFEEIHLTGRNITVDMVDWNDLEPDFRPSIAGHTLDNAIGTGSGNDNVALGAGNDTYFAGLGNDTIAGESDYDTIDYSRLDPAYRVDFSGLGSDGSGTVRILNGDGSLAATDSISGFEAIIGTAHGEAISLDVGDNALRGGGGNDTLHGGAGNDRFLFGLNDGADVLADAAIGDVLVFEGPDGSSAPVLVRGGSAGSYTYTVTFGTTTASFNSSDLLDLNVTSASIGGVTTWEMTVVDGTLVARDDSGVAFDTDEDSVLTTGDVLANDTDPGIANVQIVSFDAVSANGATVARVPGTGQFTYDPADIFDGLIDGQSATDTFTYTISDGTTTTTATVTINIAGFTDNPVAYADSATTSEDAAVTIDALANDLDPGAQDAVVTQFDSTGTGGGAVVYNGDGTFTYTPGAGFNSLGAGETGTDSFTYTLDDGRYASTTTVTVTVTGVDDPFTAQDDSRVVREDQVLTLDVLANDIDPDGDAVSLVSVGTPSVGTAQIVNGQIVYTPPLNYNGPVTFTYDATDGVSTQTATVTLNYVAVDDAPTIVNDTLTATIGRGPVEIDVLANDYDPEGGALSIVGAGLFQYQQGTVSVVNNKLVYTPAPGITPGEVKISYAIQDDAGHVTYNGVASINLVAETPPNVFNFSLLGYEDQPSTFNPTLFQDVNGDTLSVVSIQTDVPNVTIVDNGDGSYTATPDANFVGTVYLNVTVTDGLHEVSYVQGLIFNNTPDPTVAVDDVLRVAPGGAITFNDDQLLANDYNPDGVLTGWMIAYGHETGGTFSAASNIAAVSNSAGGLIGMSGPVLIYQERTGGDVTFTPTPGFHGVAGFDYTFYDSGVRQMVLGHVDVYVDNDVAAVDDIATTAEDTSVVINVLANDSDADGDTMVVHRVDQPTNGTAEVLADGTIRYTPNANFNGSETITYYVGSAFQPESAASTATITVTVTPVDDPITAVNDSVTTAEDQQVVLDLKGNDLNPEGFSGAILSVGTPTHGTIVQNGQTFTYVPDADFNGTASFDYTRDDGLGGTTTATVTVNVTAVNDAPVATADSVTVAEDGSLTFDPRGNDSDPEGATLSITALGTAGHGTAQINTDGTVTYVPDANYFGSDSFTYTVSDGELTATATITVAVQPEQDAPIAVSDSASTSEDTSVVINVLANDSEPDGEPMTVTGVTGVVNGQVQFSGGEITYTPDADFNGVEQITYTVSDGQGGMATATVSITVTAVNDAPVVINDTSSAVQSATQTLDPLANDSDVDSDQIHISGLNGTAVQPGQFVSLSSGALVFLNTDGTVSFFPGGQYDHLAQGQASVETISYTVSDGAGGASVGTIQFTVTGINDAPVAVPDSVTTQEDSAVSVGVLVNDSDAEGNPLSLAAVTDPVNGTVSFTAGGTITYTPDPNFNGSEVLSYTVSDGLGGSSTGTLTVTVAPVNDVPVTANDTASTTEDTGVIIDVLANDSDVEGATLIITSVGTPSHGDAFLAPDGTLVYIPEANFNGVDSFTYTVRDGAGGSSTATVNVTVTPVNDAPVATPAAVSTPEDTPLTIQVLDHVMDVDGDSLRIDAVGVPVNGTISFTDGTITFTPDANWSGTEDISYSVTDGQAATSGNITVTVTPVNDVPIVANDTASTMEDTAVAIDVLANDRDVESSSLQISGIGQGANGTVEIVNGQLVYTPDANFNGTDTFTYSADDGMGGTAQATVTVTVTSVNDAPVAVGDTAVTNEDSPVTLEPLANDSDPEGGVLAITALDGTPVVAGSSVTLASGAVVTLNADATVTFDPNGAFDALAAGGDPAIVRVPYSFVDAGGLTATGTIEITVTGVNDPAVFSGRMNATLSEDDAGTSGQITVTDPDSPAQMAAGSYSGSYGNLVIAADGRWNYSRTAVLDYLEPGQSVTDRFAVVAADGSSATLDITIEGALDHETIVGTAAGETLTGGTGNDTITGQGGDDTISGGDGFDYAAYLGAHDTFDFAFASDGSGFTVTDTNTRDGLDEGTDLLLAGTDAIIFADGVTGELNWKSGQPVSMVLRHNGQIIQKLSETSGGVEKVVAYHIGGATTVTYTDASMDGGSKPWASRTQTLNSNRKVTQSDIVYDDGTSRSIQNTYENGVLASQTLTDGAGSASSARWASILRILDGAGKIVRADFVFDDGTTRTAETSYVDGVRTGRIETDGSGVHSSAHWSRLERYFDTSGQLVRQVKLRDDGDRITSLFEQGVLTTRIREDLNGDQQFESKTTTFASDGTVVDTSYVWDVIG